MEPEGPLQNQEPQGASGELQRAPTCAKRIPKGAHKREPQMESPRWRAPDGEPQMESPQSESPRWRATAHWARARPPTCVIDRPPD